MSDRIRLLQDLLDRVRKNAARPRSEAEKRLEEVSEPPKTAVSAEAAPRAPFGEAAVEEAPASSRRPKLVPELELEEAAADLGDRLTPPPESGPQVASSPPPALPLELPPFVESVPAGALRPAKPPVDLVPRLRGPEPAGPTIEQLGNTLELPDAPGPSLELASEPVPVETRADELEAPLPRRSAAGTYDDSLLPPPGAQQDLERHKELIERYSLVPPEPPPPAPGASPAGIPSVFARADMPEVEVALMVNAAQQFQPTSFIEWLDGSLSLGKK